MSNAVMFIFIWLSIVMTVADAHDFMLGSAMRFGGEKTAAWGAVWILLGGASAFAAGWFA